MSININDFSFHDSRILEVKESTTEQTIDFLIDFPTDWENNIFEKKILRFYNVIYYCIDEIPFDGPPSIMEIIYLGQITKTFGTDKNRIETVRKKIEMQTNSGNRIIEFSSCDLIIDESSF